MEFKKLALAAAVASLPATGFSMEALEDSALSGVTGQNGIDIGLSLNAQLDVGIEDTDGTPAIGANPAVTGSGMILIDNMGLNGDVAIEIDAGSTAAGGGVLQANLSIPTLTVQTGDIHVGQGTDGTDAVAGIAKVTSELGAITTAPLLESVGITLNDVDLTIQLGSEATNFFALSTTTVLTIDIGALGNAADSFVLNDLSASGGGAITVDQVSLQNVDVNGITGAVTTAGLEISTNGALSGIDIAAMGVQLGSTPALGNVYVTGLDLSGQTITISGH